ncbi:hypothetical protein JCM10207_006808 [Rhodosporidiobolus poonsookiae]
MTSVITDLLSSFLNALNAAAPPSIFSSFFVPPSSFHQPCCIEHGPSGHVDLPFLGEPFTGKDGIERYYSLIGSVLKGKGSRFDADDLLVKIKEGGRSARAVWTGMATWSVQKTGKEWDEAVVWAFDLVYEDGEWNIVKWEVWADTLSAYLASQP